MRSSFGWPPRRYEILRGCIAELATAGIITESCPLLPHPEVARLAEEPLAAADEAAAAAAAAAADGSLPVGGGASPEQAGADNSCCMEEETESLQAQYLRCGGRVTLEAIGGGKRGKDGL